MEDPRTKNLPVDKQFKPGQSGNPKGRPKGMKHTKTIIAERFKKRRKMTDPITGKERWVPLHESVVDAQINQALKGNTKAFSALMDRLEGKVAQPLEHAGKDGQPLQGLPPLQVVVTGVPGTEEPIGE